MNYFTILFAFVLICNIHGYKNGFKYDCNNILDVKTTNSLIEEKDIKYICITKTSSEDKIIYLFDEWDEEYYIKTDSMFTKCFLFNTSTDYIASYALNSKFYTPTMDYKNVYIPGGTLIVRFYDGSLSDDIEFNFNFGPGPLNGIISNSNLYPKTVYKPRASYSSYLGDSYIILNNIRHGITPNEQNTFTSLIFGKDINGHPRSIHKAFSVKYYALNEFCKFMLPGNILKKTFDYTFIDKTHNSDPFMQTGSMLSWIIKTDPNIIENLVVHNTNMSGMFSISPEANTSYLIKFGKHSPKFSFNFPVYQEFELNYDDEIVIGKSNDIVYRKSILSHITPSNFKQIDDSIFIEYDYVNGFINIFQPNYAFTTRITIHTKSASKVAKAIIKFLKYDSAYSDGTFSYYFFSRLHNLTMQTESDKLMYQHRLLFKNSNQSFNLIIQNRKEENNKNSYNINNFTFVQSEVILADQLINTNTMILNDNVYKFIRNAKSPDKKIMLLSQIKKYLKSKYNSEEIKTLETQHNSFINKFSNLIKINLTWNQLDLSVITKLNISTIQNQLAHMLFISQFSIVSPFMDLGSRVFSLYTSTLSLIPIFKYVDISPFRNFLFPNLSKRATTFSDSMIYSIEYIQLIRAREFQNLVNNYTNTTSYSNQSKAKYLIKLDKQFELKYNEMFDFIKVK